MRQMNTENPDQCPRCGHDLWPFPDPADAHLGLFCPSCEHGAAAKYKRQRDRLQAVVNTPQKYWGAELCFDDGVNPFAREELRVVDVGWSDRVLIVESKTVEALQAEVARLQAEIATSHKMEEAETWRTDRLRTRAEQSEALVDKLQEAYKLAAEAAATPYTNAIIEKLHCQSGLMEWLNMHNEPLADELDAAVAKSQA